jgi:hypothetical protein
MYFSVDGTLELPDFVSLRCILAQIPQHSCGVEGLKSLCQKLSHLTENRHDEVFLFSADAGELGCMPIGS